MKKEWLNKGRLTMFSKKNYDATKVHLDELKAKLDLLDKKFEQGQKLLRKNFDKELTEEEMQTLEKLVKSELKDYSDEMKAINADLKSLKD
jgi:hypothetical protein